MQLSRLCPSDGRTFGQNWSPVGRAQTAIFCDECNAVTTRFERQWRAHLVEDDAGRSVVGVVCPDCAEFLDGDTSHTPDGSRRQPSVPMRTE